MNTNCASLNGQIPDHTGCVSLTDSRSTTGCIALYAAHGPRLNDRCVHLSRIEGRRPDEMYHPGFRAGLGALAPWARLWWQGSRAGLGALASGARLVRQGSPGSLKSPTAPSQSPILLDNIRVFIYM